MRYLPDSKEVQVLLNEFRFDMMGMYRLKIVQSNELLKPYQELEQQKKCFEDRKKEALSAIKFTSPEYKELKITEILEKYDTQIDNFQKQIQEAKPSVDMVISQKNQLFSLLQILEKLQTLHEISDDEFEQLQQIPYYNTLCSQLSKIQSDTNLHPVNISIPETEEALQKRWENEFLINAKEKVKSCTDQYELAKLIKHIGWLDEKTITTKAKYKNKRYRGDLIETISFKKVANYIDTQKNYDELNQKKEQECKKYNPEKKITKINADTPYTGNFGIMEAVINLFHKREQNPNIKTPEEKLQLENLKRERDVAAEKYSRANLDCIEFATIFKKRKIEKSKLPESEEEFRNKFVL